jgi:hypothetical protein
VLGEEDPELDPVSELGGEVDEEPEPLAAVVVVVVVDVEETVLSGVVSVGTVSVGAPAVSACGDPPPPQAETPMATAAPAHRAAIGLAMRARREVTARTSGPERVHPASAVWAVVEVLLRKLVAPIAET